MNVLASPVVVHLSHQHYARGYNLLKNIAADGVKIDAYVNQIDPETSLSQSNIRVHAIQANSRIGYYTSAFDAARRRLRDGDIDIYHHMNLGYRHFNPLLLAGLQAKTPTLLGPVEAGHDIPPEELKTVIDRSLNIELPEWAMNSIYRSGRPILDRMVNPFREGLFGRTVRSADRIVAVHQDAKEVYAEYTDREKIDVIPYGVVHDRFEYHERGEGESLVVVGNLIHRKGHEHLLKAIPNILTEFPEAHLNVIGDGPRRAELESYAAQLGITDSVTFHGRVDRSTLLTHLRSARAFVHPSLSEGFSHVRLEAMASGCPVIGTDVAGASELTRDGTDGIIVSIASPDAIAEAALTLLADDELARQMGENARKKVERDHDYADIGQQYLEIYRTLADDSEI